MLYLEPNPFARAIAGHAVHPLSRLTPQARRSSLHGCCASIKRLLKTDLQIHEAGRK